MRQKLTLIVGFLVIAVAVTFAQDPAMFFQGIQIHRDRLLLGNGINIQSCGQVACGTNLTSITFTTPTAPRTITVPDQSGTLMLAGGSGSSSIRSGAFAFNTNPGQITTGLSALTACSVSMRSSVSPTALVGAPLYFTTQLTSTPGELDVFHWSTSGASTAAVELTYICTGTP